MNETVLVALIVSVVAPSILALVTSFIRRGERREDYARQDKVAKAASDAATAAQNAAVAIEQANRDTAAKLEGIHTLVNSDFTESLAKQLVGLKAQRALHRFPPDQNEHRSVVSILDKEIVELEAHLAERVRQTALAEAQVAQQGMTRRIDQGVNTILENMAAGQARADAVPADTDAGVAADAAASSPKEDPHA